MKKILIGVQILVLILILTKVASVAGLLKKTDFLSATSLTPKQALAQPSIKPVASGAMKSSLGPSTNEASADNLVVERDLATVLAARKGDLDKRESALRVEEQRLLALKKEITDKISLLKSQEEKLTSALETCKAEDVKRYKDMAKVYESAPPAKAGKMLEQLDIKTAAAITMNMKKDKAGAVWGYITPLKAAAITKEITHAGSR